MWVNLFLKALLFIILVPRIHLSIPPGASLLEQSVIHSLFFVAANYFIYMYIRPLMERFGNPDTKADTPCPLGSIKGKNGDCRLATDIHGPFA
jgi:hypothetical protein